ncbi:MAG: hypothetical protein M3N25_08245 [Actinomycetota bacterium]|nr:hypothetical protein [Actinomycetota bacterium]
MVGLRYRLKSQPSLQRKIVMRMSSRGETPEVAGDRIKHALRYTMTVSDERLALQVRRSLDRLAEDGLASPVTIGRPR